MARRPPLMRGRVIARPAARLHGLDGIRGVAALFVVLHHCWLLSFPGYPSNTGPWWLGWLVYGHFAVVDLHRVVRLLAGDRARPGRDGSFGASVSSHADVPGGSCRRTGPRSRSASPSPGGSSPNRPRTSRRRSPWSSTGSCVQDIFGSPSPNGAFWSIAIEAQLYILFPLLLFVRRRWGAAVMLASMTAIVVMTAASCAARRSRRHADAADAAVRRAVHRRHRRRRDPRRVGSRASASVALAGRSSRSSRSCW